jgi:hypothetical protein
MEEGFTTTFLALERLWEPLRRVKAAKGRKRGNQKLKI